MYLYLSGPFFILAAIYMYFRNYSSDYDEAGNIKASALARFNLNKFVLEVQNLVINSERLSAEQKREVLEKSDLTSLCVYAKEGNVKDNTELALMMLASFEFFADDEETVDEVIKIIRKYDRRSGNRLKSCSNKGILDLAKKERAKVKKDSLKNFKEGFEHFPESRHLFKKHISILKSSPSVNILNLRATCKFNPAIQLGLQF